MLCYVPFADFRFTKLARTPISQATSQPNFIFYGYGGRISDVSSKISFKVVIFQSGQDARGTSAIWHITFRTHDAPEPDKPDYLRGRCLHPVMGCGCPNLMKNPAAQARTLSNVPSA